MSFMNKSLRRAWDFHPATFVPRYTAASLRHRALGGPKPVAALLVSDGAAYTSDQQFAPWARHAALLRERFGLVAQYRPLAAAMTVAPASLERFDMVGLKLAFRTPPDDADRIVRHFRDALAGTRTKLVYFDGDDDLNVQWPSVLSLVDLYVKKHVYANEAAYAAHYIGKSNLTDYAARQYGASFDNDIIPRSGGVAAELLGKLHLGWNIALDDKLFELSQQVPTFPAPPRDIDVSCRAYVAETMWLHPLRKAALERMEAMAGRYKVLAPRDRVPQDKYYEEMLRSKICVSPFGYGELCWRDFEAILCGCLLVKPDMGHVKTEPNLFVPGETYVPVRWDYLDLEERCAPYLADESARLAIAERARSRLLTSLEPEWFSDRFSALSRRIDLVPA